MPVFGATRLAFSSVIEPRIFTPLLPWLGTGVLFACFVPATSRAAGN
jgi:hypothetical protein